MNEKLFISVSACLLAIWLETEAKEIKPNVIIIYTDDHGTLDANCFGATDLRTPNKMHLLLMVYNLRSFMLHRSVLHHGLAY